MALVPEARRDPVLRRFALRHWKIPVKGGRLDIVCPRRADDLLDEIDEAEFAEHETFPYWAEVWASSVAIARRLRRGPALSGRAVLDLGCGVGVAGTAARTLGASVLFLDFFAEACAFAAFNAAHNPPLAGLPDAPFEARRFDWRAERPAGRFDLILAADVLYEERHVEPVLDLCLAGLAPGGCILFADPGRKPARAARERLEASGRLAVEELPTHWPDRRVAVELWRFEPAH